MYKIAGILLLTTFLFCAAVPSVYGQAVDLSQGASNQSLQGAGSSLQQPASNFQGTKPQTLTPSSGLSLNQNTSDPSGSSIRLAESETSTSVTPIDDGSGGLSIGKTLIIASLGIALIIFWRRNMAI